MSDNRWNDRIMYLTDLINYYFDCYYSLSGQPGFEQYQNHIIPVSSYYDIIWPNIMPLDNGLPDNRFPPPQHKDQIIRIIAALNGCLIRCHLKGKIPIECDSLLYVNYYNDGHTESYMPKEEDFPQWNWQTREEILMEKATKRMAIRIQHIFRRNRYDPTHPMCARFEMGSLVHLGATTREEADEYIEQFTQKWRDNNNSAQS
jgi:hypothetical protein